MKRLALLTVLLSLQIGWAQSSLQRLEYWFDGNTATLDSITLNGNLQNQSLSIPTDSLGQGFHFVHLRFVENDTSKSIPFTRSFVKFSQNSSGSGPRQVVALEYWFDNDYQSMQRETLSGGSQFNTQLDLNSLSKGLHFIHLRYQDNTGTFSSVISRPFLKSNAQNATGASNQIVALQYWTDNDFQSQQEISLSPDTSGQFTTALNLQGLSPGLHQVHIRYKQSTGTYSSPISRLVLVRAATPSGDSLNRITAIRYWANFDFSNADTLMLSPAQTYIGIDSLTFSSLDTGWQVVHYQYRDGAANWSAPISDSVFVPACDPQQREVDLISPSSHLCAGDSVVIYPIISGTPGVYQYHWYLNDQLLSSNSDSLGIDSLQDGDKLYLKITETDSCLGNTASFWSDTLSFQVDTAFFESRPLLICAGDSILIDGLYRKITGVYREVYILPSGCDSTIDFNLSVLQPDTSSETISLNAGDSLFFNGQWHYQTQQFFQSYTNQNGCDSVHQVNLIIPPLPARYFRFTSRPNFDTAVAYPFIGAPYSNFEFEVTYVDTNGVLPPFGYPRLSLDYEANAIYTDARDRILIMSEADPQDTNVRDGKIYQVNTTGLNSGRDYQVLISNQNGSELSTFGPFNYPDVLAEADLEITASDITFSQANPAVSSTLQIQAIISNVSDYTATDFFVSLRNHFDTNLVYPDLFVTQLGAHQDTTLSWTITTPAQAGWMPMEVKVDARDKLAEVNELDNTAIRPFVNGNYNLPGSISIYNSESPSRQCSQYGARINVSGYAYYSGTAIALQDSSVAGAQVQLNHAGNNYTTTTNAQGYYHFSFPALVSPGTYNYNLSITDFTLNSSVSGNYIIDSCVCINSDLVSSITLSDYAIEPGDSVDVSIRVSNYGCDSSMACNLALSQTGGLPAIPDQQIPALAPGASQVFNFFDIRFDTLGLFAFFSMADSDQINQEQNESNNSSQRLLRVAYPDSIVLPKVDSVIDLFVSSGPSGSRYECEIGQPNFNIRNSGLKAAGAFVVELKVYFNNQLDQTIYENVAGLAGRSSFSISLPYNYQGPGQYRFELAVDTMANSGGQVLEERETNNSASYQIQLLECKPDLSVSNCSGLKVRPLDPSGSITYSVNLSNTGNDTAFAPVELRFRENLLNPPLVFTLNSDLYPGQDTLIQLSSSYQSGANQALELEVDPANSLDELSEGNNSLQDSLCYEFAFRGKCGSDFWNRSYSQYDVLYPSVAVVADHLYEASVVEVEFEISGPGISGSQVLGRSSIQPLPVQNCTGPCYYKVAALNNGFPLNQAGIYTVTMRLDPDDDYAECREQNNLFTVQFQVSNPLADMRVLSEGIQPSKINPAVGEPISVDVTYSNEGASNLGDGMEILLQFNNTPWDSIKPVPGLFSKMNRTESFNRSWSSTIPGLHVIRAFIDADQEIVESNELNNEASRAVVVGNAANLYFQSFSVSNSLPALGDTVVLSAWVANNGALGVQADLRLSYVDDLLDTVLIGTQALDLDPGDSVQLDQLWQVGDTSTLVFAEILNSSEIEYNYSDNRDSLMIGSFQVQILSPDVCPDELGYATATVSGGTAPYSYTWSNGSAGDSLFAGPGTYSLSLSDATGLSLNTSFSINTLSSELTYDSVEVCGPYFWPLNNQLLSQSGTYRDTLSNSFGCDSVVELSLNILPKDSLAFNISACESYQWQGQVYTQSGIYYDSLLNLQGCDSILSLSLNILTADSSGLSVSACDSFSWRGQTYTQSGLYIDSSQSNQFGCDSLIVLDLSISNSHTAALYDTACKSYFWNGQLINQSGIYQDTLINQQGCDSIVNLTLQIDTVNVNTRIAPNKTLFALAQGATYQWYRCDSTGNFQQALIGETNDSLRPSGDGYYGVIVTQGDCTDSSDCLMVQGISLSDFMVYQEINIYPNPSDGQLIIEGLPAGKWVLQAFDAQGRRVHREELPSDGFKLSTQIAGSPGIYQLILSDLNGNFLLGPYKWIKKP